MYSRCMPKRPPSVLREPVQAYLAPDDATLLARLADATGLSKAEVLRRGIRAFAREQDTVSPMLAFIKDQPASIGGCAALPTSACRSAMPPASRSCASNGFDR